ncbi:MAG TPA: DUF6252 family protein [Saprospiraceae bacterium]|nr:DUF6252 family protein [Saprospiraceae bacterium]
MSKLSILIFTSVLLFSSCVKDDESSSDNSSSSIFQCKIDGTDYKITGDNNAYAKQTGSDLFVIYGSEDATKANFRNIYISLPKVPSVGKYDINTNDIGSGSFFQSAKLYNSAFPGGSGKLEITEKTETRVKGTFNFIGTTTTSEQKNITEGSFDVAIKQ